MSKSDVMDWDLVSYLSPTIFKSPSVPTTTTPSSMEGARKSPGRGDTMPLSATPSVEKDETVVDQDGVDVYPPGLVALTFTAREISLIVNALAKFGVADELLVAELTR
jgi:hypothetical protein